MARGRGTERGPQPPPTAGSARSLPAPQNQSKLREILCDLALLVGAVRGAQSQESQECWAGQLNRLYHHAEAFLVLLKTWEVRARPPGTGGAAGGRARCCL